MSWSEIEIAVAEGARQSCVMTRANTRRLGSRSGQRNCAIQDGQGDFMIGWYICFDSLDAKKKVLELTKSEIMLLVYFLFLVYSWCFMTWILRPHCYVTTIRENL